MALKKLLCGVLALACALCMSGCAPVAYLIEATLGRETISQAEDTLYFGFSTGTLFEDSEEVFLTDEELTAYQATSATVRASVFFDQLTDDEQRIYRALEYAMENGYTNVLFENQLVENEEPLTTVLNYVALDSPLLEQNLRFGTGTFTTYLSVPFWGPFEKSITLEGYYLEVDNFDAAHWEKKQEALAEAKRLVAEYAENEDQAVAAEELYRCLAQHVTYDTAAYTELDAVYPYLYDALVTGTTNCDGFANALSLLYNLAGIPCVEKMNDEEGSSPGHTWNTFCIGDEWYNADATTDTAIPTVACSMHAGMFFGFEDRVEDNAPKYGLMYPVCLNGLYMSVDAYAESPDGAYETVLDAFAEHNGEWALVAFREYDEDALSDLLQQVANGLGHNITSRIHQSKTDTVVCIADSTLFHD